MELIALLEDWYARNCDGDWEHDYGVRIGTLDNPGWDVDVSLSRTKLEGLAFEALSIRRSDEDWFECRVEGSSFRGYGGSRNLRDILKAFLNWAEHMSS